MPKQVDFNDSNKNLKEGQFPFKLQNEFRAPENAVIDRKSQNSVIDEESLMGFNEVSLRDDDEKSAKNPSFVNKNQLDDKVRRNLEKYEFNF